MYGVTQLELVYALLTVLVAFSVGAAALLDQCRVREGCLAEGRCSRTDSALGCGFVSVAALSAASVYNNGTAGCARGERLSALSLSCVPARPFPDALNEAAFGDRASASASERACGGWTGSRVAAGAPEYLSAASHAAFTEDAEGLLADVGMRGGLPASSMATVVERCVADSALGARSLLEAAREAYAVVSARIGAAPSAAHAAGALSGAGCASVGSFGVFMLQSGLQLRLNDGVRFDEAEMRAALYYMGEDENLVARAELALEMVALQMQPRQYLLNSELQQFTEGFFWDDPVPAHQNPNPTVYLPVTYMMPTLIDAEAAGGAMRDLLRGLAAQCFSALPQALPTAYLGGAQPARPQGPLPTAFLRHAPPGDGEGVLGDLEEIVAMAQEPVRTIDFVATQLTSTSSLASEHLDCVRMGFSFFPEEADAVLFERIVGDALYLRLQTLVERVRDGVLSALDGPVAASGGFNGSEAARQCVRTLQVRLPGAPRGTWAGRSQQRPQPALHSEMRVFEMVVQQARALLAERVRSVKASGDLAEYWVDATSTARNAFVYATEERGFAMVYFGMLAPPYASPLYSDESLEARVGQVLAHEFAHCTVNLPQERWVSAEARALLSRYAANTDREALADVLGVASSAAAGRVPWARLRDHVAQLWCARLPSGFAESGTESHPSAQRRADALVATLDPFFSE